MDLRQIVKNKIAELGPTQSAAFFGVSVATVNNWLSDKTNPTLSAAQLVLPDFQPTSTEEPLEMWEGKNVMMLYPVYRYFNPDTHFTLFANYAKYGPEKIGMEIVKRTVIHEGRNILVHKALKTKAEWFIMGDDDMILPCGNAAIFNGNYKAGVPEPCASFNAISRIMSHGKDKQIIGALYFGRHEFGQAQCSLGFDQGFEAQNTKLRNRGYTGVIPVRWVATGFLRIHRSVFEIMKKHIDEGKFPECKPANESMWYGFFNPIRVGIGEDVSFCLRAKECGITSYVDTDLILMHDGFGPKNTRNKT
jgi:hypothetical protein